MHAIAAYQYETLQVSVTDNIANVTINRPEKKNAMSFKVVEELIAVAERVSKDKALRAVILNGAEGTFCAGIDLGDLNHPKNQAFAFWELVKPWQSLFQRVCLVWRDVQYQSLPCLKGIVLVQVYNWHWLAMCVLAVLIVNYPLWRRSGAWCQIWA